MLICDRNPLKYSFKQFWGLFSSRNTTLSDLFMVTQPDTLMRNHNNLKEWYFLTKTNLEIVYNCILVDFGRIWSFIWFLFVQKYFTTYSLLFGIFFKSVRICSTKFGNSMSVWAYVTDWMRYLDFVVRKNDKWCYYIFLSFFISWCFTRFFRDFPPRFFTYCTSSMKITIWIPVADLSLDQACIYHLRAHQKNWIHSPKQHEFLHVYTCFWCTFLRQKVNLTTGENSLASFLHHKRRDP